ncbi:spore germination protein [Effusibacillus dendaii]|uniref:Spore germination protein n=1 Tax=Effusibacillus dendaii TaxID=2743772 RepID=A0A7I8DDE8_9BACL|nr:spore germination protein [Effusibacillus dendaii]BCJ86979.1 spore germination protein [Effusibacillus dendaii]
MSFWSKIGRLFTVDDSIMDEDFSLVPHDQGGGNTNGDERKQDTNDHGAGNIDGREQEKDGENHEEEKEKDIETDEKKAKAKTVKPKKMIPDKETGAIKLHSQSEKNENEKQEDKQKKAAQEIKDKPIPEKVSEQLYINRAWVEKIFHMPTNADVIIRDFTIPLSNPIKAFAVFIEGISSKETINSFILEPLMLLAELRSESMEEGALKTVKEKLLPGNQVMEYELWEDVKKNILSGSTALFLEGAKKVLIIESKGWEQRGVGETQTETVVRGPHDAFTENLRANTGLVRSRLRTESLITEMMQVGELAPTDVAVMYVDGITNPKLVQEVKRRIKGIKVDFLQDSGQLEQFIEDPPKGFIPRMMATERPDRVAASLAEGFVVVFVGQSPYGLILPTFLWSLLHTAEDAYLRFPFGSFIRLIRFVSFLMALLLPAMYIAVTNYHPEMIPTDLMLAIAAARELVPFPVVLEVLLMELSLELIREAGIRIPNVIGPTIGIVGALILGQAAVQAGIISPLLVIVVALTALASFTMPNYNFSFAVRTLRFVFILVAAIWGFYGITLGVMALLMNWATIKSFGIPMLSVVAPFKPSSPDVILRGPIFKQENRPSALRPQDSRRQRHFTRRWDPTTHDSEEARRQLEKDNSLLDQGGDQRD